MLGVSIQTEVSFNYRKRFLEKANGTIVMVVIVRDVQ